LKKIKEINLEVRRIKTFKKMQYCINNIINRKLFEKDYILNNKILLTCLLSLIAFPLEDRYCDFNLNLIKSKDPEKTNPRITTISLNEGKKENYEIKLDENICLENFKLNLYKPIKLSNNNIEMKNYDEMEKYFKTIIDIEKVNKLLLKIFSSRVMKEAFEMLYPKSFLFPFKNEEEALKYIIDNIHYVPYKSNEIGAFTDKFTLEVYYFLQMITTSFNKNKLNDNEISLIEKIFYNSHAVKANIFEMNHILDNLLFMHSNGVNSVEKIGKNDIDYNMIGINLEKLLFGRDLYKMTLSECIYILNENNYNKSLKDFIDLFLEINYQKMKFEETQIFSEFNNIYNIKDYHMLLTNAIMISYNNLEYDVNIFETCFVDDIEDEGDVLGFLK